MSESSYSPKAIHTACRRDVDNEVNSKLAYVTLMTERNEKAKIIALACALRMWKTLDDEADYVVMVTKNISSKTRKLFLCYYNCVIEVDRLPRERTKFHALGLTQYEKVLFVSNSMLILDAGFRNLFMLQPPAATISVFKDNEQSYWHGRLCRSRDIELSLKFADGVKTSLMLLKPNKTDHLRIQSFSSSCSYTSLVGNATKNYSFVRDDRACITEFYKSQWTHIHNRYTFYPWLHSLHYTPVCFDTREYDPFVIERTVNQGRECPNYQLTLVLNRWRDMIREFSKSDLYLEQLFRKYEWFGSLQA